MFLESENPMFADRLDIKDERENQNDLYNIVKNLSLLWSTAEGTFTNNIWYMENCAVRGTNKRNSNTFKELESY